MQINDQQIQKIIDAALDEDLGVKGDITSNFTIADNVAVKFQISNRQEILLCGVDAAIATFEAIAKRLNPKINLQINKHFNDGDKLEKDAVIISGEWDAKSVFAAERVALNLLQHLSGIATATNSYVSELASDKTQILDTRKTIPTLRALQKYAVKTGGGKNHRFALFDGILIKDNLIAAAGSISNAVAMVRKNLQTQNQTMPIEVECDHLTQVEEALEAKADIIMLDNMNLEKMKTAKIMIGTKAKIEVSGGITLKDIKPISAIGVDYISIGSLTHSVKAVDIGLDIA
ncbi:MAG: carboxylating nicotinate-nucleotide diphosphorylase [Proteobacteria bacterium]|nr:carboxylating nicotinate-nucleotide diphosphorylase [Pseudomonadota bacterium]